MTSYSPILLANCFVLEKQLIRLQVPEGTTKTSKYCVLAFMVLASRTDNTLVRVEMESGGDGK